MYCRYFKAIFLNVFRMCEYEYVMDSFFSEAGIVWWSVNRKRELLSGGSLKKHVWEWVPKETPKNINTRKVEEKAFLATFHKGWNEMQVMHQMGRSHKRLLKLSKRVIRWLNKLQIISCIRTRKNRSAS